MCNCIIFSLTVPVHTVLVVDAGYTTLFFYISYYNNTYYEFCEHYNITTI